MARVDLAADAPTVVPRYLYLDSLRGLAICGVVMTHAGQAVSGLSKHVEAFAEFGFRGVQLFFIVSALTLCLVTKPERFSAERFYLRRFFRIAPMFYAAGAFYLLARHLGWMDFAQTRVNVIDVISTFFFVHGLNPHGINNVVPGGWSIASEAIFYALFPVLIIKIRTLRAAIILVAFSLVLAFINGCIPLVFRHEFSDPMWRTFFHFDFLMNLPAFSCGIAIFHLLRRDIPAASRSSGDVLTIMVLGLIVIYSAVNNAIYASQLIFVLLLASLVFVTARYQSFLVSNRIWSFLGEVSFSIYLVHFAVLHTIMRIGLPPMRPNIELVLIYFLTLGLSSAVAWVTYNGIERPFISLGHRISNRNHAIVAKRTPQI